MDHYKNGVICTKHRLWKKRSTVMEVVDVLIDNGYQFVEMVYGEPNDFVFADKYEDIVKQLKRGSYFGIRLKLEKKGIQLQVESNTNGIDNVKYTIFAETEELLQIAVNDALELKSVIKPSNGLFAKGYEYISLHRQVRTVFVFVLVILSILAINQLVPILSMALSVFMFAPFIFIYLFYTYWRRR